MTAITPAAVELVRAIRLRMPHDHEFIAQSALDAYANEKLEQVAQNVWNVCQNATAEYAVRSFEAKSPAKRILKP